jgi:hypothetical protein
MTRGAVELLARWIAENIEAVPAEEQKSEIARLVTEFTAYARDAGLNSADLAELEEDIGEDLATHMKDALETARALDDDPPAGGAG